MFKTKRSLVMKKIRCIPLFALAALLAGCGNNMKAPSFANEGEEVNYVQFKGALIEAKSLSEMYDTEYYLSDRVVKASSSTSYTNNWKRGNKELSNEEYVTSATGETQFDVDNFVAKSVGETKASRKATNQEDNHTEDSKASFEAYRQIEEIKNSTYFIEANAKTKTYAMQQKISSSNKREDIFDNYIRDSMHNLANLFDSYIPMNQQEAKRYLFYNNDDTIFTFALTEEKNDNSQPYFNSYFKTKIKGQLDLTSKKEYFRLSYEVSEERTYNQDDGAYREGDVISIINKVYYDISVNGKDVNLNNVNIDDYRLTSY